MRPGITPARGRSVAIGEAARRTGVLAETIRYYERVGLVPAPPRTEGGRRVYDAEQLQALAFVRRARDLGFSLDEIRALLALASPGRASCAEVERIASAHLAEVRAKLADLARLERTLADTVGRCAAGTAPACPVLEALGAPLTRG